MTLGQKPTGKNDDIIPVALPIAEGEMMNKENDILTKLPDTGRAEDSEIQSAHDSFVSNQHMQPLIDSMPIAILVLNQQHQIIATNETMLSMVNLDITEALGKRPGELAGCCYSDEGPDGCNTGDHCRVCGALMAIMNSQFMSAKQVEECRLPLSAGGAADWQVTASPLQTGREDLTLLAIQDISDTKRRQALERIFFHDIINTISAIVGFTQLMADEYGENSELAEVIRLAYELLEEVQNQRDLTLAERGGLEVKKEKIHLQSFLQRLGQLYQRHPVAEDRCLIVDIPEHITIETDPRLLKRVIGNMIKNAYEASSEGQTVLVFCSTDENSLSLSVRNSSIMDEKTRLQVFNRSFSTKAGIGRGLGTYSMKLLGEKYLSGRVTFISEPATGTIFTLTLTV